MDADHRMLASLGITGQASDWWSRLSPEEQRQYLQEHPQSKQKMTQQPTQEPELTTAPPPISPVPSKSPEQIKTNVSSMLSKHFEPYAVQKLTEEFATEFAADPDLIADQMDAMDYVRGELDRAFGRYPEDEDEAISVAERMNSLAWDVVQAFS